MTNQRWEEGRATYRPPAERIDPRLYEVVPLVDAGADTLARSFVERHHYSRSYPAARFRSGLYRAGELVGVAVFSIPVQQRVLSNVFSDLPSLAAVELGRFVLLDEVPGNGETWFLARAFASLRSVGVKGVVSFSDPVARTDLAGRETFLGHIGTIYQAHNARYLGRGSARWLRILPDGRAFNDRTAQKIRAGERGWLPATSVLTAFGADPIAPDADRAERCAWFTTWSTQLTRRLHHSGCHRYAWSLSRVDLPPAQPYPKKAA